MKIEYNNIPKAPRHQDMDPEMMKDFAKIILNFGLEENNGLANTDNVDNNSPYYYVSMHCSPIMIGISSLQVSKLKFNVLAGVGPVSSNNKF